MLSKLYSYAISPRSPKLRRKRDRLGSDSYDADGNLLSDGLWTYSWDGENRLVAMESVSAVPEYAKKRLEFQYDHQGRRVCKTVESGYSGEGYTATNVTTFIWDGWLPITEISAGETNTYLYGLDFSGTRQGAGGVGGLLAVSHQGVAYFAAYDGNGNITDYVDSNGAVVAHREYDPFGGTIVLTGEKKDEFADWFSTKAEDRETGLLYYGYRYYSPGLGRWLSRDPIREAGGLNLYAYVANSPISLFDYLGLKCVVFVTPTSGGEEKEVSGVSDVGVFKMKMIGLNGDFHDNDFDVDFSWWHGHCLKIKFIVKIHINEDLISKTTHASGEYVGYNKHFVSGTDLKGGSSRNPVYGEVLAHEQGHAKAYFEVLKPKLEQEFESYCNDAKYSKPEQKEALKQQVKTKLDALRKDATYLQKTAEYPNTASVGYYSNGQYTPVTPPVYPSPPGLEDIFPAAAMDYVWQKK